MTNADPGKNLAAEPTVRPRRPATHLQGHGGVEAVPRVPAHQALLFAPLELPEVVLDQEGGIELPHRDLVICTNRKKQWPPPGQKMQTSRTETSGIFHPHHQLCPYTPNTHSNI